MSLHGCYSIDRSKTAPPDLKSGGANNTRRLGCGMTQRSCIEKMSFEQRQCLLRKRRKPEAICTLGRKPCPSPKSRRRRTKCLDGKATPRERWWLFHTDHFSSFYPSKCTHSAKSGLMHRSKHYLYSVVSQFELKVIFSVFREGHRLQQ